MNSITKIDVINKNWGNVTSIRNNQELRRDYLGELDKMIMDDSRQSWFGE
jgi:hypothetical protein